MTQQPTSDTSPEAFRVRCELVRKMPVWKRLAMACELTQATRMQMLADLRSRFPHASEDELRRRFISKLLTRDEVIAAYGFDPVKEGY